MKGYAIYDRKTKDVVETKYGIAFNKGYISNAKKHFSGAQGIVGNIKYHIAQRLNFDLDDFIEHWCEKNNVPVQGGYGADGKYLYNRSTLASWVDQWLRRPRSADHYEKETNRQYPNFMSDLLGIVDRDTIFRLAREAEKNNWSAYSRYSIVDVTIEKDSLSI